jgi:predicted alpha/beta hydrolase family esterase
VQSGNKIIAPQLPGNESPHYVEWLEVMNECIMNHPEENITLIGHSLGTRAVLLYLNEHDIDIEKIVLIAPFDNNTENAAFRDGAYANFFWDEVSLEKVKSHAKTIKVIGSEDDSRIPVEQAKNIASELQATLDIIPHSDHFLQAIWAGPLWEIIQQ